jgi:hypothetical protein
MSLNQESPAALSAEQKPISLPTILKDILSDKAPRPYTANAFFDFVSHTHCTESLDFIVKVQDYHNLYTSLQSFFNKEVTQESAHVGKEWKYLMSTFISPGSPSELNLPSNIRDQLLSHFDPMLSPPRPDHLNPAVRHTSEMLTDNILIPFLRSSPISNNDTIPPWDSSSHQWSGLSNSFTAEKRPFLKRSPR